MKPYCCCPEATDSLPVWTKGAVWKSKEIFALILSGHPSVRVGRGAACGGGRCFFFFFSAKKFSTTEWAERHEIQSQLTAAGSSLPMKVPELPWICEGICAPWWCCRLWGITALGFNWGRLRVSTKVYLETSTEMRSGEELAFSTLFLFTVPKNQNAVCWLCCHQLLVETTGTQRHFNLQTLLS